MNNTRCVNCMTKVSPAHADSGLPCPSCGQAKYFRVARNQSCLEYCDDKAEQFMQTGHWEDASALYTECFISGSMSAAEKTLRMATLEWRKQAVKLSLNLINTHGGQIPVNCLRETLLAEFDEYTTQWVLQEFRGLLLSQNENGLIAQKRTLS